jgi:hypothetical protein
VALPVGLPARAVVRDLALDPVVEDARKARRRAGGRREAEVPHGVPDPVEVAALLAQVVIGRRVREAREPPEELHAKTLGDGAIVLKPVLQAKAARRAPHDAREDEEQQVRA